MPVSFALYAYPNPFNSSCKIEYILPDNSQYCIDILDVMGRLIKTYSQLSKNGSVIWDGTSEHNQSVASGVYSVIISGGNQRPLVKRIILLK
jgi:flagellar hook assembly protein FlgD